MRALDAHSYGQALPYGLVSVARHTTLGDSAGDAIHGQINCG